MIAGAGSTDDGVEDKTTDQLIFFGLALDASARTGLAANGNPHAKKP